MLKKSTSNVLFLGMMTLPTGLALAQSGGGGEVRLSAKIVSGATSEKAGVLPHVLEKGAGQHRQVEFDVENDEEDTEEATPDAHFQKLSGVGYDGRRE